MAIRRGEVAQMKWCRDPWCSPRGNPACRGLKFPRETGLILRCAGKVGNPCRQSRGGPGNRGRSACGTTHVAPLEFPRETGLILRCTRLPRPWDSPGKNTGVGCHFLPQCIKVKSESEVAQSCLTLRDPMDCSPPGSSIHGIFQARVLESVAISFSRGSS